MGTEIKETTVEEEASTLVSPDGAVVEMSDTASSATGVFFPGPSLPPEPASASPPPRTGLGSASAGSGVGNGPWLGFGFGLWSGLGVRPSMRLAPLSAILRRKVKQRCMQWQR